MNLILSAYFTSKKDPQRDCFVKKDSFEYMRSWYESVAKIGRKAIILHDGLSDDFVKRHQTNRISFRRVFLVEHDVYKERFIAYLRVLSEIKADKIVITDISDVVINKDPFPFIENFTLYVGSEIRTRRENPIMVNQATKNCLALDLDKPTLNCGIIAGYAQHVIFLLKSFEFAINKLDQMAKEVSDMTIFNCIVDGLSVEKVTGYPLHSVFAKYEKNSDAYFSHK